MWVDAPYHYGAPSCGVPAWFWGVGLLLGMLPCIERRDRARTAGPALGWMFVACLLAHSGLSLIVLGHPLGIFGPPFRSWP